MVEKLKDKGKTMISYSQDQKLSTIYTQSFPPEGWVYQQEKSPKIFEESWDIMNISNRPTTTTTNK